MNDTLSLDEAQVLAWLQKHPAFFASHPELLPAAIQASGKILSLEAGQLNKLRRQNDQLREKLDGILARIRRNEEIYRAFHAIQMQLIAAAPWPMVAIATRESEILFSIQRVTVSLSDRESALVRLFQQDPPPTDLENRVFVLPHDTLLQTLGEGHAPIIRIGLEGRSRHLYFGPTAPTIRSEALVPLHNPTGNTDQTPRLIGSLNLGGAAPNRFLPSDSTDLLQDLADILGLCLARLAPA